MKCFSCLFWSLAVAVLVAGCSKNKGSQPPPLAPVKGTVTMDGKPMAGGQVRFNIPGFGPKSLEVKDGVFQGEVYTGKARVDVVWDKDGPPNAMYPGTPTKVNAVSDQFSGPNSPFNFDITQNGIPDMKLAVNSSGR